MPAKSKSQQRFMGMVRQCQKTGECASDEVKKAADSISAKDAKKYAKTKQKGLPEKVSEGMMTFREFLLEGYYRVPEFDRERYPNKEHMGLEGPYRQDSGKILYYDTKEGKYYDPDSDFYVSDDDMAGMRHSEEKRNELMDQQRGRDFKRRKRND